MNHNNMISTSTLYIVATPIGNLRDISLRALDILAAVDMVAAEDTRMTARLLAHYSIARKMMALHQHNERAMAEKVVNFLAQGKSIALVTDAGTPGISDPGSVLVSLVRDQGYKVTPIPGANAAICALSASGITMPHFLFYGFLPVNSGPRKRELEALKSLPHTLVFYEAPHRILDCVADLVEVLGMHRQLIIARELTKVFETFHRCVLHDAPAWLQADANRQKGEFVLLVSGAEVRTEEKVSDQARRTLALLLEDLPLKQAVKLATEITGESKNMLYALALALKGETNSRA
ncbi:16S rRNA (cytidine(1402)-2'-O)-methyltransferase [Nitrosospira sp. Nsp13]|uniref:16S rRNA (cytidine(1402)-2'-O)-methyltransferase n=1 Tax=Nitrosospira sp. Nsp13 TaxID=1855332 RepID=UPI000886B62C|nr:16S rRNA (cytidine(1402)-2'-O)-methyltransferase [Nitrosospira sp. Nsp13]SCY56604.1 16S rRNA (cytidine1402-2'-O)-methyltransferase [Nitrosospira sp. Nsp13]